MAEAVRTFSARPRRGTRKAVITRDIGDHIRQGEVCPTLRSGNHGRHQSSTRDSIILLGMLALVFAAILVAERRHDPAVIDGISLDMDAVGIASYDLDIGNGIDAGFDDVLPVECIPPFIPPEQVKSLEKNRQETRLGPNLRNLAFKGRQLTLYDFGNTHAPVAPYTVATYVPSSSLFYAWILITILFLIGIFFLRSSRILLGSRRRLSLSLGPLMVFDAGEPAGITMVLVTDNFVENLTSPLPAPTGTFQKYEIANFTFECTSTGLFQWFLKNEGELPGFCLICLYSSTPSSNVPVISGMDVGQDAPFVVISVCAPPSRSYSNFTTSLYGLFPNTRIGGVA